MLITPQHACPHCPSLAGGPDCRLRDPQPDLAGDFHLRGLLMRKEGQLEDSGIPRISHQGESPHGGGAQRVGTEP